MVCQCEIGHFKYGECWKVVHRIRLDRSKELDENAIFIRNLVETHFNRPCWIAWSSMIKCLAGPSTGPALKSSTVWAAYTLSSKKHLKVIHITCRSSCSS